MRLSEEMFRACGFEWNPIGTVVRVHQRYVDRLIMVWDDASSKLTYRHEFCTEPICLTRRMTVFNQFWRLAKAAGAQTERLG